MYFLLEPMDSNHANWWLFWRLFVLNKFEFWQKLFAAYDIAVSYNLDHKYHVATRHNDVLYEALEGSLASKWDPLHEYNLSAEFLVVNSRDSLLVYSIKSIFYWIKDFIFPSIYTITIMLYSLIKLFVFILFSLFWKLFLSYSPSHNLLNILINKASFNNYIWKNNRRNRKTRDFFASYPFTFKNVYLFNVQLHKTYMLHLINWKYYFKIWSYY